MRNYNVGDVVQVKLSGGRIVQAAIKAVVETTEGVRLQVSFGDETGSDIFVADGFHRMPKGWSCHTNGPRGDYPRGRCVPAVVAPAAVLSPTSTFKRIPCTVAGVIALKQLRHCVRTTKEKTTKQKKSLIRFEPSDGLLHFQPADLV